MGAVYKYMTVQTNGGGEGLIVQSDDFTNHTTTKSNFYSTD